MSVTIEVAVNRFPSLVGKLDQTIESAFDAGVAAGIVAADGRTPVDTGALRANKTIERSAGYREITWNQDYAVYQNMGTSRGVPAHGFAEASVDAAAPVIAQALGRFG